MSPENYLRHQALQRFEQAQHRALISRIGRKLIRQPLNLLPFTPVYAHLPHPNGLDRGVQEIPLLHIVGSLGRATEYDRAFRPLQRSQRERWVKIWMLHAQSGWDPITVRQVGNLYFVEDGHHRTSVARDAGLAVIEATVTEYPVACAFDPNVRLDKVLQCLKNPGHLDQADPLPQFSPPILA